MTSFCLEVSGDFACFTRPEMKVERVSYDVITPSAARSVFEAILWKPAIRWEVRRIEVLKPIKWISVRRNEVSANASVRNAQTAMNAGQGNLALYIEDAIKASLNRLQRFQPNQSLDKELSDMLDLENISPAYRLGRLFAVLERIQEKAINPNTTIRERYYGAASSSPISVFTTLLRLKNHHLAKLNERENVYFERLLGEIMGGLNDFPKHLSLPEQGRFALGYYHQRQDFFSKSESSQSTQGESK